MKKIAIAAAVLALATSAVMADQIVTTCTEVKPGDPTTDYTIKTTLVASSIDSWWFYPPDGATPIYVYKGAHITPAAGAKIGAVVYKGVSGGSGGGGGGKLEHLMGDFKGPGVNLSWTNTTTGKTVTWNVNFSFVSGTITFTGTTNGGFNSTPTSTVTPCSPVAAGPGLGPVMTLWPHAASL